MTPKVLIVVGPTASGKTSLSIELAKRFHGEVVSADSRQVYTGLDIGTGKVTKREMRGVPHHLLDVASPRRRLSAGSYERRAKAAIKDITRRGKLPIVCGGTGFYIDALTGRMHLPRVAPDAQLRRSLEDASTEELYQRLARLDPARAEQMASPSERKNRARLIRAIEIATHLGSVPPRTESRSPYECLWIGIKPEDATLRQNINTRLAARIKKGMITEAKRLHTAGLSYRRMEELGLEYRSLARHLQGRISKEAMEAELQSDIWRYARKQIGYWKRNSDVGWYDPSERAAIISRVSEWLSA